MGYADRNLWSVGTISLIGISKRLGELTKWAKTAPHLLPPSSGLPKSGPVTPDQKSQLEAEMAEMDSKFDSDYFGILGIRLWLFRYTWSHIYSV